MSQAEGYKEGTGMLETEQGTRESISWLLIGAGIIGLASIGVFGLGGLEVPMMMLVSGLVALSGVLVNPQTWE